MSLFRLGRILFSPQRKKPKDIFEFYDRMTKVSGFKFRSGFAMEPHPRHKKMIEEKSSSSSFSPFSTILSKSISAVISPLKPQEEVVKAPSDGKKEEENKEEDKYKLRKESNVIMNGEDSLLGGETFLCICDGVGGWKFTTSKDDPDQKKFDPSSALYTALLTQQIEIILQEHLSQKNVEGNLEKSISPTKIIEQAYSLVDRDEIVGSCTVLLAILAGQKLKITNIGDCGILLIRNGKKTFRTTEQQHSFNYPYQLGTGSKTVPSDADNYEISLQEEDIIVVGSDGLFDNLYEEHIIDIVNNLKKGKQLNDVNPELIANKLLKEAVDISRDTRANSPFETEATQEGIFFQGGKTDDISIFVAFIEKESEF